MRSITVGYRANAHKLHHNYSFFTIHFSLTKTLFVLTYIRTNRVCNLSVVPPKLLQSSHFESKLSYCRTDILLPAARGSDDLLPRVLHRGACRGTHTVIRSLKAAFQSYSLVHRNHGSRKNKFSTIFYDYNARRKNLQAFCIKFFDFT